MCAYLHTYTYSQIYDLYSWNLERMNLLNLYVKHVEKENRPNYLGMDEEHNSIIPPRKANLTLRMTLPESPLCACVCSSSSYSCYDGW